MPFNGGTLVTVEGFFDPATGKAEWTFAGPDGLDDPFAPTPRSVLLGYWRASWKSTSAGCPLWRVKRRRLDSFAGPRRCPNFYLMIDTRQLQDRPCAPTLNMRVRLGGLSPCPRRPGNRVCIGLKGSAT